MSTKSAFCDLPTNLTGWKLVEKGTKRGNGERQVRKGRKYKRKKKVREKSRVKREEKVSQGLKIPTKQFSCKVSLIPEKNLPTQLKTKEKEKGHITIVQVTIYQKTSCQSAKRNYTRKNQKTRGDSEWKIGLENMAQ